MIRLSLRTRLRFTPPPLVARSILPRLHFHSSPPALGVHPFKLVDIGEGITEVELVKWHVKPGDTVEEFDVLCEVQSDKSTVELTSPYVGVINKLGAEEGVVLKVGEVICNIETDADAGEVEPEATVDSAQEPSRSIKAQEEEEGHDESLFRSRDESLDIAGGAQFSGEAAMLPSPPPSRPPPPPPPAPSSPSKHATQSPREQEHKPWSELRRTVKASPAVRTFAARLGVDLGGVDATGDGGRVTKDDIQRTLGGPSSAAPSSAHPSSGGMTRAQGARDAVEKSTRVEFGRTRKVMYRAMGDMGSVPHFGYSHTLNLTPLLPYMKALNTPPSPTEKKNYLANDIPASLARDPLLDLAAREKTTILSFLIKGLLMAMEEHPIMRSRVKESGGDKWLEVAKDGTIAVAVSDPKYGLVTPSLPALPPSTPISQITTHLSTLRQAATRPTPPGSITISSVGPLGEARGAMPVLPPGGGVAICAVGRAMWALEPKLTGSNKKGVWDWTAEEVKDAGVEGVLRVPVGWSGDHRVLEGAELIAFTETWKKYIEQPWRWLKVDG